MRLSQTYRWDHADEAEDPETELFSFNVAERFVPEGEGKGAPFVLGASAWHRLGKPHRLKVTVEAA